MTLPQHTRLSGCSHAHSCGLVVELRCRGSVCSLPRSGYRLPTSCCSRDRQHSACKHRESILPVSNQPRSCQTAEQPQCSGQVAHEQPLAGQPVAVSTLCMLLSACLVLPSPAGAAVHPSLDLAAEISPRTAGLIATVARPVLSIYIFLMLARIVLSWYPNIKGNKLPWSAAVFPTEFFLGPTRRAAPPVGGVDIAPVCLLRHCGCLTCKGAANSQAASLTTVQICE